MIEKMLKWLFGANSKTTAVAIATVICTIASMFFKHDISPDAKEYLTNAIYALLALGFYYAKDAKDNT